MKQDELERQQAAASKLELELSDAHAATALAKQQMEQNVRESAATGNMVDGMLKAQVDELLEELSHSAEELKMSEQTLESERRTHLQQMEDSRRK